MKFIHVSCYPVHLGINWFVNNFNDFFFSFTKATILLDGVSYDYARLALDCGFTRMDFQYRSNFHYSVNGCKKIFYRLLYKTRTK